MFGRSSSSVASHQSLATTFLKDGGQPSKTEFPRVKGKCSHLLHQYLTPCANVVVISNSGIDPPTQKDLVQGPPLFLHWGSILQSRGLEGERGGQTIGRMKAPGSHRRTVQERT